MRDNLEGILWALGIIYTSAVLLGYYYLRQAYRKLLADYQRTAAVLEFLLEQFGEAKLEAAENKRLMAEVQKCQQQ